MQANRFHNGAAIYSFTTENLSGYFPCLHLRDARLLSVCGSGDQCCNAAMFGARHVTLFDINSAAIFWAQLKLAALRLFTLEQFLSFFLIDAPNGAERNRRALDYQGYLRLRPLLEEEAQRFFDHCYLQFGFSGADLRVSSLFNNRYDTNQLKLMSNTYLRGESSYQRARRGLARMSISWRRASLRALAAQVKSGYNLILLSNIADYAQELFPGNPRYLETFINELVAPLKRLLGRHGTICAAYIYKCSEGENRRSQIDDPRLRRQLFGGIGLFYEELSFTGVMPGKSDAVVLLRND